ncbi:AT hook motif DNA-binding family protein [Striga asiatica]|uniref:AT-hook motif nuclear-localized protein n=1 Tax=Striga asiatica TaxID=4170 RepID=A0A5A7RJW8_STRAF|nr:AT hook motif DNA-binding family protein [Striga asiatica]
MDHQREAMTLSSTASYYVPEPTLSNSTVHFQSNTGPSLNVPPSMPSAHGRVEVGPPTMQQAQPVRRKRGRPRKYGHDSTVSLGLCPSVSNAAQNVRPTQKSRGRPPGSSCKLQLASTTGGSMFNATGTMTPYIINVAVGEDIKVKVLSLLQDRRAIVVLSGVGYIAAANIKIPSSNGSVTYEGHFDMVNLSGSFINEADEPQGSTGGLTVTFMGPDGRLIGGPVEGILIAASPVQVIIGIIMPSTPKPKYKAVENRDTSGDQDRTLGNSTDQANIQPSQSLSTMGIWQSSR